jgi:hypothetical protein
MKFAVGQSAVSLSNRVVKLPGISRWWITIGRPLADKSGTGRQWVISLRKLKLLRNENVNRIDISRVLRFSFFTCVIKGRHWLGPGALAGSAFRFVIDAVESATKG